MNLPTTEDREYVVTTHTREARRRLDMQVGALSFGYTCRSATTDISHPDLPHVGLPADPAVFPDSDATLEVRCTDMLAGAARKWVRKRAHAHRVDVRDRSKDASASLESQLAAQLAWHHHLSLSGRLQTGCGPYSTNKEQTG
mgnify:CR=1 FL=1